MLPKKIDQKAPHEVILILDATTGQNVLNQVEEFNKNYSSYWINYDKNLIVRLKAEF